MRWRMAAQFAAITALAGITAWSAILAKESGTAPPLARTEITPEAGTDVPADETGLLATLEGLPIIDPIGVENSPAASEPDSPSGAPASDASSARYYPEGTRFFDGRPIRPVRTVTMTVTAYSPDARSCPGTDDNLTATLHHVTTNHFRLAAADPKVLPYGSMISIPGYDDSRVVPVLDCGSAIKGRRLDLLFPTHEEARAWGVRKIPVTIWGYADGKPAKNPRKLR